MQGVRGAIVYLQSDLPSSGQTWPAPAPRLPRGGALDFHPLTRPPTALCWARAARGSPGHPTPGPTSGRRGRRRRKAPRVALGTENCPFLPPKATCLPSGTPAALQPHPVPGFPREDISTPTSPRVSGQLLWGRVNEVGGQVTVKGKTASTDGLRRWRKTSGALRPRG